jgi:tetratricopeptide (TPR) repeat protein
VLIPPEPGMPPRPVEPWELDVADRGRPNRTFLYIGALVLVAVLVGAWVVYQQWSDWFPNANGEAASGREHDPIQKATSYHKLGRTDLAIAQLNSLPPNDPHYEEAQALISQWEAEAGETAREPEPDPDKPAATEDQGDEEGDGTGADAKVRQEDLVAQSRQAAARGDYLPAENLLLKARQLGELDAEGRSLEADIQEHLEPMRREIELVRGGDWEFALPDLWRLREDDPENPDINRLLVMSYYNLGVRDLQQGDAAGAVSQFEEAQNLLDQPDADLERHLRFARAYQGRSKDLLYQIYVKYLPIRR